MSNIDNMNKPELLEYMRLKAKNLIGTKYKYNVLNGFRGYSNWSKAHMKEFIKTFLTV